MGVSAGIIHAVFEADAPDSRWAREHIPYLRGLSWVRSAALFRVVDGDGSWVALYDVEYPDGVSIGGTIKAAVTSQLGASSETDVSSFLEVFAAVDARPISETDRYVFIPWADFSGDPETEDAFNNWYNTIHVPDVADAGIVRARRYRAAGKAWQYFATYDMWARDTMSSEPIQKVRGFGPFSGNIRALRRFIIEVAARYHGASADIDREFWTSLEALPRNWGRWGADDEVGSLNHLDASEISRGMSAARQGKVFSLGVPIADPHGDPVWPGRVETLRYNTQDRGSYVYGKASPFAGGVEYADDIAVMFLQGTTHFDALGHEWVDATIWNGYPADTTVDRLSRASVYAIARRGVVGRGVLVDMARYRGKRRLDSGESFSLDELLKAAAKQKLTILKHDILLIRTGWLKAFYEEGREAFYKQPFAEPGMSWQPEVGHWFHDMEIPAFVTDTISNEGTRCSDGSLRPAFHIALMRNLGVVFVEIAWLEELAEDCAKDGQYDFAFVAGPLKIVGGTGAPVNPIAIK